MVTPRATLSLDYARYATPQPPASIWTKNEWRQLEQSFTEIRIELACEQDAVEIDPDEVDLDLVVDHFVTAWGKGRELTGDWEWYVNSPVLG